MSRRKWQPVVVIGSGPRLVRVARALGGDVRCIDVRQLKNAYGAAVAGEVVSHLAVASVGLRRPGSRRKSG
jgi:hypothetical protein